MREHQIRANKSVLNLFQSSCMKIEPDQELEDSIAKATTRREWERLKKQQQDNILHERSTKIKNYIEYRSVLVLSCLIWSGLIWSGLIWSCLALSCLVLSCLVLSCLVLPCLILSDLALSCLVLLRLVVSCRVVFCGCLL